MSSESARQKKSHPTVPLIISNGVDASGRVLADFAIDILAVVILGASAFEIGLLNALGSASFLILGIPIGIYVDRHPTEKLLTFSGLVRAILLATIVIAALTGALTFIHLAIVVGLVGIATVVTETAQTTLVPRIVGTDVASTISRMQAADSAAGLIIPGLAGITIAVLSPSILLSIGAASIGAAALLAATIRISVDSPTSTEETESTGSALKQFFGEATEGWRVLRRDRLLWRLTVSSAVINLSLAVFAAVEAVLIVRTLDLGAPALGFATSAGALGALIGSITATKLISFRTNRLLLVSSWLLPISAGLTTTAIIDQDRALAWIVAGSILWGFAIVSYNIAKSTRVAALAPVETLGRVSALGRTISMGVVPGGSIGGGLLASWLGMPVALGTWLILTIVGAAIVTSATRGGMTVRHP